MLRIDSWLLARLCSGLLLPLTPSDRDCCCMCSAILCGMIIWAAMILACLSQPIFIAAKINSIVEQNGGLWDGLEDTKWTVLLIPTWLLGILWIALAFDERNRECKATACLMALERSCWYMTMIFLARKWDNAWSVDYSIILIPGFIAIIFRWMSHLTYMQSLRHKGCRMVTMEYLKREVLHGASLEDMPRSEQERIRDRFLIVRVPSGFRPCADDSRRLDENELETRMIRSSTVYKRAAKKYNHALGSLIGSLVFESAFLIVLTLKLDRRIDATYWVVFTPLWILKAGQLCYNCCQYIFPDIMRDMFSLHIPLQRRNQSVFKVAKAKFHSTEEHPIPPLIVNTSGTHNETSCTPKERLARASPKEKAIKEYTQARVAKASIQDEKDDDWAQKHCFSCFSLGAQLLLCAMVVAKIEKCHDNDNPDDVGFNTYWILIPLFLCCGFVLSEYYYEEG